MLSEKLYTVSDVASLTGMTDRTIRNYLKDGSLKGRKIGVQWRFTENDIQQLFREYSAAPAFSEMEDAAIYDLLKHQTAGTVSVTKVENISATQALEIQNRLRAQAEQVQILCQYQESTACARFIFSGPSSQLVKLLQELY